MDLLSYYDNRSLHLLSNFHSLKSEKREHICYSNNSLLVLKYGGAFQPKGEKGYLFNAREQAHVSA